MEIESIGNKAKSNKTNKYEKVKQGSVLRSMNDKSKEHLAGNDV